MIETRLKQQLADTLDGQLAQAGIAGGEHGDQYKAFIKTLSGLLVPVDDFGRAAYVCAVLQRDGYLLTPPPACDDCEQRLRVVKGTPGKIAAHFRHIGGKACAGGMSPWHLAMQRAAVTVGFEAEYPLGNRFLDAFHSGSGLCLEFVNSMSREYQKKHAELIAVAEAGGQVRNVAWIFNSGARFATSDEEETVDPKKLYAGKIAVGNLFREERGVRELIHSIGERHCFTIYRGLMFRCIGCDYWECLPESDPLQWMCQHDRGFNFATYLQGVDGVGKRVRVRGLLQDSGRVDSETVRKKLIGLFESGKIIASTAISYQTTKPDLLSKDTEVSEKAPSANAPVRCSGKSVSPSGNNVPAAVVKEQLYQATQDRACVEIPEWKNDLPCGQVPEAWEPPTAPTSPVQPQLSKPSNVTLRQPTTQTTAATVRRDFPGVTVRPAVESRKTHYFGDSFMELVGERAAIMEFDGGLSRPAAEQMAWNEVVLLRRLAWLKEATDGAAQG